MQNRMLPLALCVALSGSVLLPAQAQAKRLFVQRGDLEISAGSEVSIGFKKANAAGNLIVVYVVWDNAGSVAVTDSRGNAYVSAVGPTQATGDPTSAQIFYARNIAGGSNSVTASFATAITTHGALYVHEYTGVGRMLPLDAAVAASGSDPNMDSGSISTHSSAEFLFMAAESNAGSVKRVSHGYHARAHGRGSLTADTITGAAGSYHVTAVQAGTAWVMQLVAFEYSGPTPASLRYPLEVSANGRYLIDQQGAPFLITGDSPQSLMVNLSEREANAFFANRQKRGFNTVWINLLCATETGGREDGSTYDGIAPFTTPFDLSTPDESYFSRVDAMVRLAAQRGLTVLLDPAETKRFLQVLQDNGVTKAREYGRYLGTRYRGFDNIIWMNGNDFHESVLPSPEEDAVVQAVARGIQDTDESHIHTVELNFKLSGSLDDPSWAPLIQLNASYTYYPTYAQVLADYNRPNALPTFLVEANYEFENEAKDQNTPRILRRQAYWSLLSGATGQMYGNGYTWPFLAGWQHHVDTPGAIQMGYVKRLFESRAWFDLIPDQAHTVVTAGNGTFSDSDPVGSNDYVTAARTPDGALVMAYMPTTQPITVDMSQLAAPAYASWYDPSRGTFRAIAGSPLDNTSAHDFTPPGANRDGDSDWVLVLEVTPAHARN